MPYTFTFKSSPLKPMNQVNPSLAEIIHIKQLIEPILPFENENYHRLIISLQANNLTSLFPYATDLTSDR
jgi:hypothetical protein